MNEHERRGLEFSRRMEQNGSGMNGGIRLHSRWTLSETGEFFGVKYTAIRRAAIRGNEHLAKDKKLEKELTEICAQI